MYIYVYNIHAYQFNAQKYMINTVKNNNKINILALNIVFNKCI